MAGEGPLGSHQGHQWRWRDNDGFQDVVEVDSERFADGLEERAEGKGGLKDDA